MTAREQLEHLAQTMPESEAEAYLALPETLAAQEELLTVVECLFPPDQWDTQMAALKPGPPGTVVVELLTSRPELEALRAAMLRARGEASPAKETT